MNRPTRKSGKSMDRGGKVRVYWTTDSELEACDDPRIYKDREKANEYCFYGDLIQIEIRESPKPKSGKVR